MYILHPAANESAAYEYHIALCWNPHTRVDTGVVLLQGRPLTAGPARGQGTSFVHTPRSPCLPPPLLPNSAADSLQPLETKTVLTEEEQKKKCLTQDAMHTWY